MIVVVMGVAGSGKSSVAGALAARLGCRFIEGDAFHPPANREKMASGTPLTDADRWPWLDALAGELARHAAVGESAVLACSALKRSYRDRLRRGCADLALVFLDGDPALIGARLARRRGHYMPASLLASQLEALERPHASERAVVVDAGAAAPADIARAVAAALGLTVSDG